MTSLAPTSSEMTSWQTLLALDHQSDDFTRLARRLLSDQRHRKAEVPQFTEEEASKLIELMDVTILRRVDVPSDLKGTAFVILRGLCSAFGRLPRSCLTGDGLGTQEGIPFATHGYADLWKLEWGGRRVAVKTLRFTSGDDRSKMTKMFCKETLLWKRLNNPNILPFYGVSMNPNELCMVSPWMENGNIINYTRKNPEVNRVRLLIDAASGLKFLHRMSLTGANIRGSNILISDSHPPRALLGDFGMNAIIPDPLSLTRSSVNWTAPEFLTPDGAPYQPSVAGDVYAFGMVIYEVLTGAPPFAGGGMVELACRIVLEGERPPRPMFSEKLGFTDEVWGNLRRCWEKKPFARPSVDAVSVCLEQAAETWVVDVPAFMLASEAGVEQVMGLKEDQAKDFVNWLDKTLDQIGIGQNVGRTYLKYLQRLCDASGVLPASFMLTEGFDDIEVRPFTKGGFAEVYRARYKGQSVVVKVLKTTPMDTLENIYQRFVKEVVRWKWLRHENILPFVGVTSVPTPFSMVSVWMENGDITSFMKTSPDQNPFSLLVDVTNGLQCLHNRGVVHGDLKGANVLISSERRACLGDFGLAEIVECVTRAEGPSDHKAGGTTRWMAPEILDRDRYGYARSPWKLPSKSTDIYALGMTILEVISGRRPFEYVERDAAVIQKVLLGQRPDRPIVGFSDPLWALLSRMWLEEHESSSPARPNITDILQQLEYEVQTWSPTRRLLAPPMQMDQRVSLASSVGSFVFSKGVVCFTGDFEEVMPPDVGGFNSGSNDILRNIDEIIDPEPSHCDFDDRDISTQDSKTSPAVSPIVGSGGRVGQTATQPQATSSSIPPTSLPRGHPVLSRTKEKSGVRKTWSEFKKLLVKEFWRGDPPPQKLSDRLVSKHDGEVRWYEALFSKSPQPTRIRK